MAAPHLVGLLTHLRDDLLAQVRGAWGRGLGWVNRTWAARHPPPRLAAQALVLALIALGLASLDARERLADRLPAPLDWRALTALLERDARPGDLVAILPPWLERARQAVPARLAVLASSALETEWFPGVRRVWLVEADGVTAPAPVPPLAARSSTLVTQQLGRLRVTRLTLAAPLSPLASLAERSGTPTRWREIDGVGRRCMELAPRAGALARLKLPPITLGGSISGHAAVRPPGGKGRARLRVQVEGELPVTAEVTADGGWQPFRFDTMRFAQTPRLLTVEAEAPAGTVLCLEALVLP